jgi:hypothetical protein
MLSNELALIPDAFLTPPTMDTTKDKMQHGIATAANVPEWYSGITPEVTSNRKVT